ncbi:response regulator transcription factor [Paenibacillus cymbidii]|uniref:response regulator transcription factor n=1 Tax=Paenibacillus cymbidii TaxID=1639034 RepID=UPI0010810E51|nr:response regulator transcription factor [Paenibacillus cymbidii]
MDVFDKGKPIVVWIVEDDADWLRGLSGYLGKQPDLALAFASGDPAEVRRKLQEPNAAADVVLMDIMLHGAPEGIALAEETIAAIGAKVVMLTSMEERELIFRSFQAGALDYRIKADFESLPDAVRQAAAKASPISPAAAERMREEFRRLKKLEREFEVSRMRDKITPSELHLLDMIDQGYSQSQIADKRFVSIRTIKNQINYLLKKLQLTSSKDAARQAKEYGLLERTDVKEARDDDPGTM